MSKQKRESAASTEVLSVFQTDDSLQKSTEAGRSGNLKSDWKRKLLYPFAGFALLALIAMGAMAKNGWLPRTDAVTGKKSGWFGAALPQNASSSWNPMAAPLVTATPQLSKEYIYAGSRMLAVEDANANAAPPADLAIWRPSNGQWWVMGSAGSQQTTIAWGMAGDETVPGDYDGDGKTDFSIYRPDTGVWYIVNSSTSDQTTTINGFGQSGDKSAPADFDGDGKTDAAIFRPSEQRWYINQSSGVVRHEVFGLSTDKPVPADFDGDGKADVAVWRSGNATFYIYRSSDNSLQTISMPYGQSTDQPIVGDYDGDGKADAAVRRGNNWHLLRSSNNNAETIVTNFGYASDEAVQNDYDADGKVDVAVWRGGPAGDPNIGVWYIRQSSKLGQANEVRAVQWGTTGDKPVPAFYRR